MNHSHDSQPGQTSAPPFWRSRYALGLLVFGGIAAYFLLSEHRAHFLGATPFLLLLACPLMQVFMHRGHGGHRGHDGHGAGNPRPSVEAPDSTTPARSSPSAAGDKP